MIGVIVTFRYDHPIDRAAVAGIAHDASDRFRGMPGLRSKVFTIDRERDEATNVYIWEDEQAARAFFSDALIERVAGLYGVRPTVRFLDVAELVDNAPAASQS